jgi:flagellar protein FlaJ
MLIYLAIIYLAFAVFIFVVGVIVTMFLPLLLKGGVQAMSSKGGMIGTQLLSIDTFRLLIYHATLIQGLFSGLLAGHMGEGSLTAGVKHVCILLIIALVAFNTII